MIDEQVEHAPDAATGPPSASGKVSGWRRLLNQNPADLQARRERHRRRPMIVRVGVVAGGGILSVVGLPLLLAPELGLPLLLGGLGLLALEFNWAARLLGHVLGWAAHVQLRFQRLSRLSKALVVVVVLGLIAVAIWVSFLR